jgi:uncharacterized protein (TIGR03435 family)
MLLVGLALGALPLAAQSDAPRFEVASVKRNLSSDFSRPPGSPDRLDIINLSLDRIIRTAYNLLRDYQLTGMPSWAFSERFDIRVKANRALTGPERLEILQALLAARFQLKARYETRQGPAYVLRRISLNRPLGSGLRARPDCAPPNECEVGGNISVDKGVLAFGTIGIKALEGILASALNRPVHDETAVEGYYDISLAWAPLAVADDPRPSLFTAVQEQLGLILTVESRPFEVLVIESVERPTPD